MNRNVATLLCAIVLFLIAGCGSGDTAEKTAEKAIDFKQLVERDGIWYEVNSEVGFTGRSVGTYENGQKKSEGTFKDGKKNGKVTLWYENGQMEKQSTYKDGKYDGTVTVWFKNGQKQYEGTFKDGKENGKVTLWNENGQKQLESTYENGEEIDLTVGDENGREK